MKKIYNNNQKITEYKNKIKKIVLHWIKIVTRVIDKYKAMYKYQYES